MEQHLSGADSPRKRLKISDHQAVVAPGAPATADLQAAPTADAQALKEAEVGITGFVCPDLPGFSGILKKRYTDFLVNEILPSGQVLHLQDLKVPASLRPDSRELSAQKASEPPNETPAQPTTETVSEPRQQNDGTSDAVVEAAETTAAADNGQLESQISEQDQKLLEQYLGADVTAKVVKLYGRALAKPHLKAGDLGRVKSEPVPEKDTRTIVHQALRRIFGGRIESSTESDNSLLLSPVPIKRLKSQMKGGVADNRRGKLGWSEVGGEYLHFTVYKENKDTMEVMNFLARQLKLGIKGLKFAGTKDRRGVTVQRASAFRLDAGRLANMNRTLRNAAVGDFKYEKQGLELGDLGGNECYHSTSGEHANAFYIAPQRVWMRRKAAARRRGHLMGPDDILRAEAIHVFQSTGEVGPALAKMPRKFTAESAIIKHLGRKKNDYLGALQTIPRNLRLIYVHAYQALVWNHAAGERWRLYGDRVVEGDLVLIHEFKETDDSRAAMAEEVDADGEAIVLPNTNDSAVSADSVFERARPLTSEEAGSGKYTIFDVVLPLPGYDIIYPPNQLTDFYKTFMGSERGGKLDPFDMRRQWKDISLSGGYRKILSRPGADYSFEVKQYTDDNEQFIKTDLERIREKASDAQGESNNQQQSVQDEQMDAAKEKKLAVVIKFQLGASQYATMALRELMKTGGAKEYRPEYAGGRR
ncbi:conserved hypothetical protein [Uncinocarpus reesii 1704]|uniref:TRUD domain-containing protein n=1 Tax=Uncinocarpus reesii (strain UAMH 1704) TaxID=336963 RepID=C4JIR8_UNCRE|nr:uncharacterized protein UREG_02929 [Uncinocarpus reesii 1704]EEP78080.1 conserved hypothetical protein [Uncinocarpus reesii 1704]